MRISTDTKAMLDYALQIYARETDIKITESLSFDQEKPTEWKVNWCSMGPQTAEDARQYAVAIIRATEIAEDLNGLQIIEDRDRELDIRRENHEEGVEDILYAFGQDGDTLEEVLAHIEASYK